MVITEELITYRQFMAGHEIAGDDDGVCAPILTKEYLNTFLSNPYLTEDNKDRVFYHIVRLNGKVAARRMAMPTLFKIGDRIVESRGGSNLFVAEYARKFALGAQILLYPIEHKTDDYLLYAGLSDMVFPSYKKMRFATFSTPKMRQPRDAGFVFQILGLKGLPCSVATFVGNCFLKPFIWMGGMVTKCLCSGYAVREFSTVPDWVDDIVMNDAHKYSEFHDHRWMQWTLENCLNPDSRNCRKFFGVFRSGEPVAFFMLKEYHNSSGKWRIEHFCIGSIYEWGIKPGERLSEYKLTRLALNSLSRDVDVAEFTSSNAKVVKRLRRMAFFRHGDAHIAFKDITRKLDPDHKLIENWRIRLGYSDVPFN